MEALFNFPFNFASGTVVQLILKGVFIQMYECSVPIELFKQLVHPNISIQVK